jgi:hypothetical protein
VGTLVFSGERITIWAGRAANDLTLIVAGMPGGLVPWPDVGHRAFDGEEASVMVDNDQKERLGRWRVGHEAILSRLALTAFYSQGEL